MAAGAAANPVNDWRTVAPDDWQTVGRSAPDTATAKNSSYTNIGADWQGIKNFAKQTPLGLIPALAHPVDAVTGMAKSMYSNAKSEGEEAIDAAKQGSYGAALSHGIQAIPLIGQGMKSAGEDMNVSPLDENGNRPNTYGSNLKNLISSPKSMGTLAGMSGMLAAGGLKSLDKAAPTRTPFAPIAAPLRDAAIGDTDAAALRGLRVPANGKKVLPMQSAVDIARPYLEGSSTLKDLQSRIPDAKKEVFAPYRQTVDAEGKTPVIGPDGPTTIGELEQERLELSAINRGLRSGDPSSLKLAEQKGLTQAQSLEREQAIRNALDPALSRYGIDPQGIRKTYGAISRIGNQVEGRSTLLEKPKAYGLGRLGKIGIFASEHPGDGSSLGLFSSPFKLAGEVGGAVRDIAAGRPLLKGSPTDIGIREGFRGNFPKPDMGQYTPFRPAGELKAPPIELNRPPEVGGVPEGYRPPPFYHDTDAMRTGRLLNAPPIQLGGEIHVPAQSTFRYDTAPMRQGRILPPPTEDLPPSSYNEIFEDQIPQATRIRPKIVEGKK